MVEGRGAAHCSPGCVAPPTLLRKSSHNARQATMYLSFLPRVNASTGGTRPQGRGLSHRTVQGAPTTHLSMTRGGYALKGPRVATSTTSGWTGREPVPADIQ